MISYDYSNVLEIKLPQKKKIGLAFNSDFHNRIDFSFFGGQITPENIRNKYDII